MRRDNMTCQYCGAPAQSVDHIIPVSRGGQSAWDNVVRPPSPSRPDSDRGRAPLPALRTSQPRTRAHQVVACCFSCNNRKGNKLLEAPPPLVLSGHAASLTPY